MSREATGGASIGLGVIIIATNFYNPLAWISGLTLIAGGVVSLTMSPKADSPEQTQNQDLQAATATEGIPVPVIFGEVKMPGNFMRYLKDNFRVVEIRGESGVSGKGGGSAPDTVIGHQFFLTYEYALCMGPVDGVVQVWSQPGEKKMLGDTPVPLEFGGADFLELTLDEVDPENPSGKQGGLVRIYKGSPAQTRINNNGEDPYQVDGMQYRNLCWVLYEDFQLGRFPQPRSYQWILRRLPKCIRDNGSTVTGIVTRGSAIPANTAYWDANPAAIVYEILTNDLWGRGMSSDLIDEQSFIDSSVYLESQNIGMSFSIRNPDRLVDLMDVIRNHVKAVLVWDEDKLKFKCLLDRAQTNVGIKTLNKTDFVTVNIQRPMWDSTLNEVRVEFNSKDRNYRPDMVAAQNLANIQQVGGINTKKLTMNGFTDFNTARRQAQRVLDEVSVPIGVLRGTINRFQAGMEVGDTFRVVMDDWTPAASANITTYWTLMSLADSSEQDDVVEIEAIMYPHIPALDGTETGDLTPDVQWENLPDLDKTDIDLFDPIRPGNDEILPIMALELSMAWSKRVAPREQMIIVGEKVNPDLVAMNVLYNRTQQGQNFLPLGVSTTFALSGETLAAFPAGKSHDRSSSGIFFELANEDRSSEMVGVATQVQTSSEHLEDLELSFQDFLFVNGEIMQVGYIENVGVNQWRARNLIRGLFGTRVMRHPIGSPIFYTKNFPNTIDTVSRGTGIMRLRAVPVGTGGITEFGELFSVNVVNATDRVSLVAHPYQKNNGIRFQADTMPDPLIEGTTYYVVNKALDSFKVAAAPNGIAIDITTDGVNVEVQAVAASDFYITQFEFPLWDQNYAERGARPLRPGLIIEGTADHNTGGNTVTLKTRVRFGEKGADFAPFFGQYEAASDLMTGEIVSTNVDKVTLGFLGQWVNSNGAVLSGVPGASTVTPVDFVDVEGGVALVSFFPVETIPATAETFRVYSRYNANSLDYVSIKVSDITVI